MVVETLVLALVLAGASIGLGQQQPGAPPKQRRIRVEEEEVVFPGTKTAPTKSKLEEMLTEALKNNPDIRVAAAKVAEADAELNRTRLQVTQKVIALHHALLSQKAEVAYRQTQYERFKQLAAAKSIDATLLDEQQQRLTLAKAKLAELEAQMPALLGKAATASLRLHSMAFSPDGQTLAIRSDGRVRFWETTPGTRITTVQGEWQMVPHRTGPLTERIRKALETPIKVDYKDMTFDAILKDLAKKVPGLSFRNMLKLGGNIKEGTMSLRFDEALPVSAILQALADDYRISFVVREYGILVTRRDNVPPEAITVQEFLRQKPAEKK